MQTNPDRIHVEKWRGATCTYYGVYISPQYRVAAWRAYEDGVSSVKVQVLDRTGETQKDAVFNVYTDKAPMTVVREIAALIVSLEES